MKGVRIPYSAKELAWIKRHCTKPRREAHARFCAKFGRDVSLKAYNALCKRKGWLTGRTGQIAPGSKPWNKGQKMPYNPNTAKTQFKKGQIPPNAKPLGHERISKDGYVEINIAERNPHTGYDRRYVLKHRHLWEKENGPVPAGMCLKSMDGNRQNTDPSNWALIPRGALPFMNGHRGHNYEAAEPEVKPAILTLDKLKHTRSVKAESRAVEIGAKAIVQELKVILGNEFNGRQAARELNVPYPLVLRWAKEKPETSGGKVFNGC